MTTIDSATARSAVQPCSRTCTTAVETTSCIYRMVTNPQARSYAFQVNRGQTTLSQNLKGAGSQHHHFLGQVADWLVHDLAGIDQQAGSTAHRKLLIRPAVGDGIDEIRCVEGSYTTPAGVASNRVERHDDGLDMTVTVPANTTAEVWVPAEDGAAVLAPVRARMLRVEDEYHVYAVGAGEFTFSVGSG